VANGRGGRKGGNAPADRSAAAFRKSGLKTTYYLRSRPATRIAQATVPAQEGRANTAAGQQPSKEQAVQEPGEPAAGRQPSKEQAVQERAAAAGVACSLENPESCEACQ
jgi:ribonucleoside-diphosphate reductase alpha chain